MKQQGQLIKLIHIGLASDICPGIPPMHLYLGYTQRLQPRLGLLPRPAPKIKFPEGGVLDAPLPHSKPPPGSEPSSYRGSAIFHRRSGSGSLTPEAASLQGSVAIATLQVLGRSTLRGWNKEVFEEAIRLLHEEAAKQLLGPDGRPKPSTYLLDDGLGTITGFFGETGDRSGVWESCGSRAKTWAEDVCVASSSLSW